MGALTSTNFNTADLPGPRTNPNNALILLMQIQYQSIVCLFLCLEIILPTFGVNEIQIILVKLIRLRTY